MRPPTERELAGWSCPRADEILYREGVALGLGRDEPVIKRRVRRARRRRGNWRATPGVRSGRLSGQT
jgi:hypothetical protein